MKEIYSSQPEAVEVFRVGDDTDLILRKNIEKQQMTDDEGKAYTVYACDERQVRYAGVLTAEEVKKNFDKWWDYAPPTPVPVPEKKKLEDRVKELEAQSTTMARPAHQYPDGTLRCVRTGVERNQHRHRMSTEV